MTIQADRQGRITGAPEELWKVAMIVQRAIRNQSHRDGGGFSREALDFVNAVGRATITPSVPFSEPGESHHRTMGLTVREAATRRGCSESLIRRMARNGQLPATRQGHQWVIDPDAVGPAPEP